MSEKRPQFWLFACQVFQIIKSMSMASPDIVALIPIREGSERIRNKNFIDFAGGRSLLDIKINHLKQAGCFNRIYISSDSDRTKQIAKENWIDFLERATEMCQSSVIWADVVEHIMNTIPGNPIVIWALATSPLFNRYTNAVEDFLAHKENDSLLAVLPKKSFLINKFEK